MQAAVTFRCFFYICLYYRLLQWKITFDINPVACAVICADILAKKDSFLLQHEQRKVITTWNCFTSMLTFHQCLVWASKDGIFLKNMGILNLHLFNHLSEKNSQGWEAQIWLCSFGCIRTGEKNRPGTGKGSYAHSWALSPEAGWSPHNYLLGSAPTMSEPHVPEHWVPEFWFPSLRQRGDSDL